MSNASSKRSVMTLFSNKNDIYCHQVKIVLAEKGVAYENEEVDLQALSEDLMELNPYGTLPTLVDRDLVLFSSRIIMEYLDERFPHPPLMPVYPVSRAKSRLLMLRIEQDWYPTLEIAEKGKQFLDDMFTQMGLTVVIEKMMTKDKITFQVHGEDLGILIGKHGQTLDAIQYLTNLVAHKDVSGHCHIVVDVEN
ncbi:MAG: KH domain-containing protein, partial [Haemophilus parainfluenzae]|nr:KH domain-containing protein [Haemophilus parainfluenzae]